MKHKDFEEFVRQKCMYETIYDDSEGRRILVIRLLDAYTMVNKKKEWVGLTDEEMFAALVQVDPLTKRLAPGFEYFARAIEDKLKEKNGD